MAKQPIPLPVVVEETPPEECPKCPPVGAPAWMATFADMATLLMAFFVLILSFAEFNQPKFKMVAGSLKNSFGVQRVVPVLQQPQGTTILDLKFSPNPDPAVVEQMKQETTDQTKPEVQDGESDGSDGDEQDKNEQTSAAEAAEQAQAQAAQDLADALQEALASGQVTAEVRDGEVVMSFNSDATQPQDLAEQLNQAAQAMAQAQEGQENSETEVLMEGLENALPQLAEAMGQQKSDSEGQGANADAAGQAARSAALAEAKLRVALNREVSQGLVTIEQRDDKVFVTVGAGGAFPSGEADLTEQARDIMARLSFSAMSDASTIEVTGHTDDVPLNGASPFRDNWGLGAARASSVVREIGASGLIDPTRLTATSKGESAPVADNTTPEGREKNRRIEIEISY